MGLLPLRLPPKPQPCEGYQTLCAALPLIVFLGSPFRRTRGSLSALHTNHPFVLQGVCPAGVGPGGQTIFILFQVDGQLAERQMFHYPPYYRLVYVYLKNRNETLLDLMAQTMAGKLRAIFGNRVLGPDKPPVARVQTLFIRKIVVKIETKAPMAHVRELLIQVQKEMVMEDRFKSLIVYYDVDPM